MAKAGAIRASGAFVELFADDSALARGLRAAGAKLKAWGASVGNIGKAVGGAGLALTSGFIGAAKVFATVGDELEEMSQRTGVSVETLSELRLGLSETGADMGMFEKSIRKMQKTLGDATPGDSAVEALTELKLTLGELQRLSPEEQFTLIADRISQIDDPTKKAALALELFGRSGTMLLPFIEDGAAGIEQFRKKARALGETMSKEDAAAAGKLNDALSALGRVVKTALVLIGQGLGPIITDLANKMLAWVPTVKALAEKNKELIATLFKVGLGLTAAGAALVVVGAAISGLGAVLGVAAKLWTLLGGAINIAIGLFTFILSPIGLVITGLTALGVALLTMTETGQQALEWLGDRFKDFAKTATQTFQGVADALAAGDLALAAKVAWAGLKAAWFEGTLDIRDAWQDFTTWLASHFINAWSGAQVVITEIWDGLRVAWTETTAFMSSAWASFTSFLIRGWNTAVGFLQKTWARFKSFFTDEDISSEIEAIDADTQAANDAILKQSGERVAAIEKERAAARKRISDENKAKIAAIVDENDALQRTNRAIGEAKKQANAKAAADARAEFDAARKQAADARAELDAAGPNAGKFAIKPKKGLGPVDDLPDKLADAVKQSVIGTFNPFGVRGLSSNSAAERTAKATEETARNTRFIANGAQAPKFT